MDENEVEVYLLDEAIDQAYADWKAAAPGSEERARISKEIEEFYGLRLKDYQAMQEANEKTELEKAKMRSGIVQTVLDIFKIALPSVVTVFVTGAVMKFEEEGVVKSKTWSWLGRRL